METHDELFGLQELALDATYQYVPWRGVTRETMEKYGVTTKVLADGKPAAIGFAYGNGRTKVRDINEKRFSVVGELTADTGYLFGRDAFPAGSAQAITITEGELDALSAFQLLGSKYPVVSVSSASSARTDCTKDYEYLNSFSKIYVCFDNDEPGQRAVQAVAGLFDFNKVYHVKLDKYKDANDYLTNNDTKSFVSTWWAAKRFLPQNVLSSWQEYDKIIDDEEVKESVSYPFDKLTEQTYGIRTGELVLVTAMEGIGKTEIFRAIEYHLLKNTEANVGIIHLEEGKSRIIKGLAGYELNQPVHLPDTQASKEDIKKAFRELTKKDERVHVYTHFGSDDPDTILNTIRFMAGACQCKYIFLDHITLVVTGLQSEDERKALDYISTKLAMMVEELDFTMFLISHVNDEGQTRGSRNISKVADLHIDLYRDVAAPDDDTRNTTRLTIKKNRFSGRTGPSSVLKFDLSTYKVSEFLEPPL